MKHALTPPDRRARVAHECGALLACLASACAAPTLANQPVALLGMEEPLDLLEEPDDEALRLALPPGCFSGLVVGDARTSLDAMLGEPDGVLVLEVVENSPAAAARIEVGDLLLEARGERQLALRWPSAWRALELESAPGSRWEVLLERAGAELSTELVLEARLRPAPRSDAERLREELRAGVVLRGATEVEARAVGLGPGAGAVLVGMTRESPWRAAGLRYGDCIFAVNGQDLAHPQQLVDAIQAAPPGGALRLALLRQGQRLELEAPLSRRERELTRAALPPLFSFERDRDRSTTSLLLGLFEYERTQAAWRLQFLWLIELSGGDADRLVELE